MSGVVDDDGLDLAGYCFGEELFVSFEGDLARKRLQDYVAVYY